MKVKVFDLEKDYEMVCSWWSKRGSPPVPKSILPNTGIIIEGGDAEIAVGWAYFEENGKLGVVDFITGNPDQKASLIAQAVSMLLDFFQKLANDRGCHRLISFVAKDSGLHRQLVRSGWIDPKSPPHVYLLHAWQ